MGSNSSFQRRPACFYVMQTKRQERSERNGARTGTTIPHTLRRGEKRTASDKTSGSGTIQIIHILKRDDEALQEKL